MNSRRGGNQALFGLGCELFLLATAFWEDAASASGVVAATPVLAFLALGPAVCSAVDDDAVAEVVDGSSL